MMNHDISLIATSAAFLLSGGVSIAALSPAQRVDIMAGAATLIALWGVWMCWRAPRYRMSIEEHAKDGQITEEQARRKLRVASYSGPVVTSIGLALLAVVVFT